MTRQDADNNAEDIRHGHGARHHGQRTTDNGPMMGIAQKVSRNFSEAVRTRGQSYFVKGRVTVMAARAGEVVARVRGTAKYRVRVRLRGSKLLASCSCPYFGPQGEPCKHLWATLLLADSRGLLQSPPVFPVRLVVEGPRRPPPTGLPEVRDQSGMERRPPYPMDSDLGVIGLGSPRPMGAGRGPKPRAKDRGTRGEPLGEVGGWSQRDRGPSARERRAKAKSSGPGSGIVGAGPGRGASRPSTGTASGCWSTFWTWPRPWRRTRW